MASEVSICNRAIQIVGGLRIASLSDASKNARECSTAYEPLRDALLRSQRWTFAIARAQLAADATYAAARAAEVVAGTSSSFWPANKFPFPTDALRILFTNDADTDWQVEGRAILTNWDAPLNIRYVQKITDPNTMDAMFREALSARIGFAICEAITGSNTKQAAATAAYTTAIAEARRIGAMEMLSDEAPESDFILVRR